MGYASEQALERENEKKRKIKELIEGEEDE